MGTRLRTGWQYCCHRRRGEWYLHVVFFMQKIRIIFNAEAMTIDFAIEHTDRI